jgi:Ca2+-binding EF-hand superfamily protein
MIPLVAVVAILCLPPANALDPAPAQPSAMGEAFDVLYLADVRPVVVRFRFVANGKPIEDAWNSFVDALFTKLDEDKNGSIDRQELRKLRPILTLLSVQSNAQPVASGGLNRAEFADYLRKSNLGPFRLPAPTDGPVQARARRMQAGSNATTEELDQALLDLLDSNHDRKLSVAELEAAPAILAALDTDENEFITTEEILRRPLLPYFVVVGVARNPIGSGLDLVPLTRKGSDATLARSLLSRYGPNPAGTIPIPPPRPKAGNGPPPAIRPAPTVRRLNRKALGLSEETFAALDQDGDGYLDAEELARFGSTCSPDVEILFRMGALASGTGPAQVISPGQPPVTAVMAGRGVAVEVPGVRLDLLPPTRATLSPPPLQAQYLRIFRTLDVDGNGYVDTTEAQRNPTFSAIFSLLDRDGDGKVFEKELTAALDEVDELSEAAARGILSLEVEEAGRGLFGLFDANGDGRLSLREIRALPTLVERFGKNRDGGISPNETPRRFQLTFSHAITGAVGPLQAPVRMASQGAPQPAIGPLWFQKMDRNRDGDVSRREFLGTEEDFRRLDLDGDGLIDVHEAEAAGKGDATLAPPPKPRSRK